MDTRSPSLITTGLVVVSVIFPILSLGSVLLRIKARLRTKAGLLGDDWWIVATWVSRRILMVVSPRLVASAARQEQCD